MSTGETSFDGLCDGPLRELLAGAEAARRRALGLAGLILAPGLVGVAVLTSRLTGDGAYWTFVLGSVAVIWAAWTPLASARAALKRPVLAAAAGRHGFDYAADGFEPDGYPRLAAAVGRATGREFSDRFAGDHAGRPVALYEARLSVGAGRSRRRVFAGLVHVTHRRTALHGDIVVVPDRGWFNVFRPKPGLRRVRYEDEAFERAFEVYASDEVEARSVVNATLRRRLMEWRGAKGRLFLILGGDEAVLAISDNRDRFEPGSLLLGTPARARARRMADEADAALARLRDIAGALG